MLQDHHRPQNAVARVDTVRKDKPAAIGRPALLRRSLTRPSRRFPARSCVRRSSRQAPTRRRQDQRRAHRSSRCHRFHHRHRQSRRRCIPVVAVPSWPEARRDQQRRHCHPVRQPARCPRCSPGTFPSRPGVLRGLAARQRHRHNRRVVHPALDELEVAGQDLIRAVNVVEVCSIAGNPRSVCAGNQRISPRVDARRVAHEAQVVIIVRSNSSTRPTTTRGPPAHRI